MAVTWKGNSFSVLQVVPENTQKKTSHAAHSKLFVNMDNKHNSLCKIYLYVLHQRGGPYWEKLCLRSWIPPEGGTQDRGHSFSQ